MDDVFESVIPGVATDEQLGQIMDALNAELRRQFMEPVQLPEIDERPLDLRYVGKYRILELFDANKEHFITRVEIGGKSIK